MIVTNDLLRNKCYDLRFEVLRKPWGKLKGSETDDMEEESILLSAIEGTDVIGTVRIQFNNNTEAQLRYMAVSPLFQGKGVGKKLEKFAVGIIEDKGCDEIILQARDNAVQFYKSCGYEVVEKSYVLFDQIQHYLMKKSLNKRKL